MQDKLCSRQYTVGRKIAHCSLLIAHCLLLTNIVFAEELPTLDLQQLVDEALKNNPELISAKYRVEAFKKEPMKEITVMQSLPYPGKLSLKSEMAQKEAEAAEEEYKDIEIKLIQMVK